jgi:hypothetical protein
MFWGNGTPKMKQVLREKSGESSFVAALIPNGQSRKTIASQWLLSFGSGLSEKTWSGVSAERKNRH